MATSRNKEKLQEEVDEGPVVSTGSFPSESVTAKAEEVLNDFSHGLTQEDFDERDRRVYGTVDSVESRTKNVWIN